MATVLFYILSVVLLAATLLSITRRNPVHAVIYLVNGLFALAIIFYLLGAPLVAAWEVIIYAGAIMVLFMFIIMMLEMVPREPPAGPGWQRWGPVALISVTILFCTLLLITQDPDLAAQHGSPYMVPPREYGKALFGKYALAVQIVSFQLLFAAVGAYYVGKGDGASRHKEQS
jgi:NADH-quinone oxidoreductase subunit J